MWKGIILGVFDRQVLSLSRRSKFGTSQIEWIRLGTTSTKAHEFRSTPNLNTNTAYDVLN